MAYYTVRYSYTTVRTRLEFSETDLRTVSGYDEFAVNSSQVEFLLTVRTNILVKHHPVVSDNTYLASGSKLSCLATMKLSVFSFKDGCLLAII